MKRKRTAFLILAVLVSLLFHIAIIGSFLYFLRLSKLEKNKLPPLPKETIVDIVTLPKPKQKQPKIKEKHKVAANISKKGQARVYSKEEELPFGFNKKLAIGKKTPGKPNINKKAKEKTKTVAKSTNKGTVIGIGKQKKKEQIVKIKGGLFQPQAKRPGFLAGKSLEYKYKNAKREATISIGTQSIKYASYMEHIKNKIENVWVYPPEAAQTGQQGRLLILFSIGKNGDLVRLKLIRSSGYPLLDKAALQAVRDASPFPPLPDRFHLDVLNIYATFEYSLGFRYIQ